VALQVLDQLLILGFSQDRPPPCFRRPAATPCNGVEQVERIDAVTTMYGCAGPWITPGGAEHSRTDRVALNVTHRCEEMPIVQRAGVEAVLPEVAAPIVHSVDVLRVSQMGSADCFRQRLGFAGCADDVDVVGHQAVAEYNQTEAFRLLCERAQEEPAVSISEEDVLSIVAALGDMMWDVRNDDSSSSGHVRIVPQIDRRVNNW